MTIRTNASDNPFFARLQEHINNTLENPVVIMLQDHLGRNIAGDGLLLRVDSKYAVSTDPQRVEQTILQKAQELSDDFVTEELTTHKSDKRLTHRKFQWSDLWSQRFSKRSDLTVKVFFGELNHTRKHRGYNLTYKPDDPENVLLAIDPAWWNEDAAFARKMCSMALFGHALGLKVDNFEKEKLKQYMLQRMVRLDLPMDETEE